MVKTVKTSKYLMGNTGNDGCKKTLHACMGILEILNRHLNIFIKLTLSIIDDHKQIESPRNKRWAWQF